MKKYKELQKSLPSRTVIAAFEDFNPPTYQHEMLIRSVQHISEQTQLPHYIFISEHSGPLPVNRKLHYLQRMFPEINWVVAESLAQAIHYLYRKGHTNLQFVVGTDKVQQLSESNELVNFISAEQRDPDTSTRMQLFATRNDYKAFRASLPTIITEMDAKKLYNETRKGLGLTEVQENVQVPVSESREKYHSGQFQPGQSVTDKLGKVWKIMERRTNYVVVESEGKQEKKWISDLSLTMDTKLRYKDLIKK